MLPLCSLALTALQFGAGRRNAAPPLRAVRSSAPQCVASLQPKAASDAITAEEPLNVVIAGAGVGGLILANCLEMSNAHVKYTVLERTGEFKKFGGPIQLASNAMQSFRDIDSELYSEIEGLATWTGNRTNGIKDGIRDEWYAKFDLQSPAEERGMPFTCVVERPDLQDILLKRTSHAVRNNAGVETYTSEEDGSVTLTLSDGEQVHADVLIGADGIWSNVPRCPLRLRITLPSAPPHHAALCASASHHMMAWRHHGLAASWHGGYLHASAHLRLPRLTVASDHRPSYSTPRIAPLRHTTHCPSYSIRHAGMPDGRRHATTPCPMAADTLASYPALTAPLRMIAAHRPSLSVPPCPSLPPCAMRHDVTRCDTIAAGARGDDRHAAAWTRVWCHLLWLHCLCWRAGLRRRGHTR
jgi:hypothetical protein